MSHQLSNKTKRRIQLVLDLVSTICAYFIASWARFSFRMKPWQSQLYRTVLIFTLLCYLFMYTYRHVRGHFYDIQKMDMVENFGRILRERFLLYVVLILFLGLTHSMGKVSRSFLLVMAAMDLLLDYLFRMFYRQVLTHSEKETVSNDRYLLVTSMSYALIGLERLKDGMAKGMGGSVIAGIALWPDDEQLIPSDIQGIRVLGRANEIFSADPGQTFNRVYIYLPEVGADVMKWIIEQCDRIGLPADVCLTMRGNVIPRKMIQAGAGTQSGNGGSGEYHYAVAEYTNMRTRCPVLGVSFSVSDPEAAACFILNHLKSLKGQYICFSNVHTTVMAREDDSYRAIQNGAAYTFADGAPIAAMERYQGFSAAERCAGPDFMDAVFRATMDGRVGHYFYGSTPGTIKLLKEKLEKRYPGVRICGLYSPPFRKLEDTSGKEDSEDIRRINESGADLIWIGLGAPKQERWMAAHQGKISGTMFGVGAGFNFYAGNVKRAPGWMQKMGLEWLYRLFQDPKRLFNRYLVTNLKFVWYILTDSFRKM